MSKYCQKSNSLSEELKAQDVTPVNIPNEKRYIKYRESRIEQYFKDNGLTTDTFFDYLYEMEVKKDKRTACCFTNWGTLTSTDRHTRPDEFLRKSYATAASWRRDYPEAN